MPSLTQQINKYLERDASAFHSPAHCGSLNPRDLSELEGLDNLQNPQEVLKDAQDFVAQIFNAQKSFFLIGGASIGMQAACLSLKLYLQENKINKPVLIARNLHKSVIAGLVLADLVAEFFEPAWHEKLGVYTHVDLSEVDLNKYSAVILTNPSYEGFHSQLEKINIPLIVDEAHGAHYHFSDKLPQPALELGADVVVQSWHKTLGSLTQTGVAHLAKDSKIEPAFFAKALRLLQTTSPSYLLLESITKVAEAYANQGEKILDEVLTRAHLLNSNYYNQDPSRFLIYQAGYSGVELDEILEANNISVEAVLTNHVLAIINPGLKENDIERLKSLLASLEPREAKIVSTEKPQSLLGLQDFRTEFFQGLDFDAPCPPGIIRKVMKTDGF